MCIRDSNQTNQRWMYRNLRYAYGFSDTSVCARAAGSCLGPSSNSQRPKVHAAAFGRAFHEESLEVPEEPSAEMRHLSFFDLYEQQNVEV
eukprot:2428242-Prymnesium_polylepis.1